MNDKNISSLVIYKLMLIGFGVSIMVLSTIIGIAGIFGAGVVKFNDKLITGIAALPVSLFSGLLITVGFTAIFGTLTFIGLWLYSKVRPLKIKVID